MKEIVIYTLNMLGFNQNKLKWYLLAIFLVINILIWQRIAAYELKDDLKVVFLDVGQGDSILIEAKNDKVLRKLSQEMSSFDRSIDVIIATHPDSDHIGGLVPVLNRFESDVYIESGAKADTLVYKSLEKALDNKNLKRIVAKRGMTIDLGNEIYLKVLFPDRDVSNIDPNAASVILQLTHSEIDFMLTGDSPASIEKYLASIDGNFLESEVLKIGHHGSKTSTSLVFLGLVDPEYSVVSAGEGNSYGHPHKEVLDRLENFGVKVLETPKFGSITFFSDGRNVWRK
jgi:competence protein ComEC